MKIRSKIVEITYLAMLLKTAGYDCFVGFSAHVNTFDVRLFEGEWDSKKEPITAEFEVCDSIASLEKASSVIYQQKRILKKKDINYEILQVQERIEYTYHF